MDRGSHSTADKNGGCTRREAFAGRERGRSRGFGDGWCGGGQDSSQQRSHRERRRAVVPSGGGGHLGLAAIFHQPRGAATPLRAPAGASGRRLLLLSSGWGNKHRPSLGTTCEPHTAQKLPRSHPRLAPWASPRPKSQSCPAFSVPADLFAAGPSSVPIRATPFGRRPPPASATATCRPRAGHPG